MTSEADIAISNSRRRRELTRFLKFSVVGTIGFVVDFSTFNLLTRILQINSIFAQMISFCAGVTSNFIWNRYWTYPDSRSKPAAQQAVQFLVVSVIGLGIRTLIFLLFEEVLIQFAGIILTIFPNTLVSLVPLLQFLQAETLGQNMTLIVATIVVLFWNFTINRFWTYSDVS